jgi:hypothetical protein
MRGGGWGCLNGLLHELPDEAQLQRTKRKATPVISPLKLVLIRPPKSPFLHYPAQPFA